MVRKSANKSSEERVVVMDSDICQEIERFGLDEACKQPLHFLSSFGQLSYKQCMHLVVIIKYSRLSYMIIIFKL